MSGTGNVPVSVLILTRNEEGNIADCLASCRWADDVSVLDSGSTDRTTAVARDLGAAVYHHPFESFGAQRNWAIDHIPTKHEWVFHLDADERFTPELVDEMRRVVGAAPAEAGFHVPSKLMFMGRWLRRAGGYPVYQVRLFHRGQLRFEDYGHGQRELTGGRLGRLASPYLHYNFSKGLDDWIDKHNYYSTREAERIVEDKHADRRGWRDLVGGDPVARRRALKQVWYRLPCRPTARWAWVMFVQGAWLEGRAGWTYASLLTLYERMIVLKARVGNRERE